MTPFATVPAGRGSNNARIPALLLGLMILAMSGCAVRLAPDYSPAIVDGLTGANERTMTLFAAVSDGTDAASFDQRADEYNAIIGSFDAIRVEANARPTPQPWLARQLGLQPNPDTDPDNIELLEAPTSDILVTVVDTLTQMRNTDRTAGLSETVVEGFKGSYEISIEQALTYERALER
jgi:hypothetical protein